ncbi:exosortase system-associated protein, TIGR04073 family [Pelotalea chapellei]|uniref:Exosortase system-associated protein, TIGR04073 family n=1 Tax=Pelotalea chapellei TaxID=44671 RepID=A0ABS5U996_9BACT|nr:exosortase system-associated protein, TIGR04073 family [Pelotalea chapellei]MBT1072238.1 exosortase system-associated protein, TIGR04073 family [Pelotalea chapellei]
MKSRQLLPALLLVILLVMPCIASAEQPPERIAEKMAIKLTRGVTNLVTSVAELPKQTVLTVREMGTPGYVVGPLKGIGMTLYRAFIGATETVFFLVPQPGYYDPMMEPVYVWQGWEPKYDSSATPAPAVEEKK